MMKKLWFSLFLCGFVVFGMFAQETEIDEDPLISELMQIKSKMTKKNEFGDRYKIQLGSFGSMDRAKELIKEFENNYDDYPAELHYESPNYKVWVGDFPSRLSADRVFLELKSDFKSAFIFKPRS